MTRIRAIQSSAPSFFMRITPFDALYRAAGSGLASIIIERMPEGAGITKNLIYFFLKKLGRIFN
jgi:hypothetical protein